MVYFSTLANLTNELESKQFLTSYSANPLKCYVIYHQRWLKVWPTMIDWILELGHKQILRQQLAFELNRSSKVNAKNLESALETFNRLAVKTLQNSYFSKIFSTIFEILILFSLIFSRSLLNELENTDTQLHNYN